MNQPVKNPQGQPPMGQNPQGVRPQNPRPTAGTAPAGQRPVGTPNMTRPPMGNAPQAGRRPMQPGVRPGQPMRNRPMQPQAGQPVQRPMQPQGAMQRQAPMGTQGQPRVVVPQPGPHQPSGQGQAQVQQTQPATRASQENMDSVNTAQEMERSPYVPNFATDFNLPASVIQTKGILSIFGVTLIIGMIFGSIFFGGSDNAPRPTGLQGVVRNPDITSEMKRCGLIDKGQACVLYIMNTTRYDKKAEDFFDDAVKLTEIQKFSIQMVNPKYAKTIIPPGRFAQIKIPNVR